ncbi:MAG: DUF4835 family protein [Chitinophagaceae bacterium]|nr:DUF4835 family protein [Chitinophagaceae bacterium]
MRKIILILLPVMFFAQLVLAQEINSRVRIQDNQLPTTIDRKTFRTLEAALTSFINKRKWGNDDFQPNEKINCQFLINLTKMPDLNFFEGTLTVQVARPVYQSSYVSPIINFQDAAVQFKYIESQPLEFNENRISGSDPLASNLTAVVAYYVYLILGFDYDSFSQRGGDVYFQKALNIVSNFPESGKLTGWKLIDSDRNRYWLTDNLLNNRYNIIHDVYYTYYRKGMDKMYEDETTARSEILNALVYLDNLSRDNPNLMIVQFFMLGKADELIGVFKKATPQDKSRALEILSRLDITNSNKYKQELK